jgi:hypothetical protein
MTPREQQGGPMPLGWEEHEGDYVREVGDFRCKISKGFVGWGWTVNQGGKFLAGGGCEPTAIDAAGRALRAVADAKGGRR